MYVHTGVRAYGHTGIERCKNHTRKRRSLDTLLGLSESPGAHVSPAGSAGWAHNATHADPHAARSTPPPGPRSLAAPPVQGSKKSAAHWWAFRFLAMAP